MKPRSSMRAIMRRLLGLDGSPRPPMKPLSRTGESRWVPQIAQRGPRRHGSKRAAVIAHRYDDVSVRDYDRVRFYPVVRDALHTLRAPLVRASFHFACSDRRIADLADELLRPAIPGLVETLVRGAHEFGRQTVEKVWEPAWDVEVTSTQSTGGPATTRYPMAWSIRRFGSLAPQDTVLLLDGHTGRLAGIRQYVGTAEQKDIPASRLVHYVGDGEHDTLYGIPRTKAAVPFVELAESIYDDMALYSNLFAVPYKVGRHKPGFSVGGVDPNGEPVRIDNAGLMNEMLTALASGHSVSLPSEYDAASGHPLWDLQVIAAPGEDRYVEKIEHVNSQIRLSLLVPEMAGGGDAPDTGTYGLGKAQIDLFLANAEGELDRLADCLNRQLLADFARFNFGPDAPDLRIVWEPLTAGVRAQLLQALLAQLGAGAPVEDADGNQYQADWPALAEEAGVPLVVQSQAQRLDELKGAIADKLMGLAGGPGGGGGPAGGGGSAGVASRGPEAEEGGDDPEGDPGGDSGGDSGGGGPPDGGSGGGPSGGGGSAGVAPRGEGSVAFGEDAGGRRHAPAGGPDGGQFVSGPGGGSDEGGGREFFREDGALDLGALAASRPSLSVLREDALAHAETLIGKSVQNGPTGRSIRITAGAIDKKRSGPPIKTAPLLALEPILERMNIQHTADDRDGRRMKWHYFGLPTANPDTGLVVMVREDVNGQLFYDLALDKEGPASARPMLSEESKDTWLLSGEALNTILRRFGPEVQVLNLQGEADAGDRDFWAGLVESCGVAVRLFDESQVKRDSAGRFASKGELAAAHGGQLLQDSAWTRGRLPHLVVHEGTIYAAVKDADGGYTLRRATRADVMPALLKKIDDHLHRLHAAKAGLDGEAGPAGGEAPAPKQPALAGVQASFAALQAVESKYFTAAQQRELDNLGGRIGNLDARIGSLKGTIDQYRDDAHLRGLYEGYLASAEAARQGFADQMAAKVAEYGNKLPRPAGAGSDLEAAQRDHSEAIARHADGLRAEFEAELGETGGRPGAHWYDVDALGPLAAENCTALGRHHWESTLKPAVGEAAAEVARNQDAVERLKAKREQAWSLEAPALLDAQQELTEAVATAGKARAKLWDAVADYLASHHGGRAEMPAGIAISAPKSARQRKRGESMAAFEERKRNPPAAQLKSAADLAFSLMPPRMREAAERAAKEIVPIDGRAFFQPGAGKVAVRVGDRRAMAHELMHAVEHGDERELRLSRMYLQSRIKPGEKPKSLGRGMTSEVAYYDEFHEPYTGKVYPNATEIMSVGIEGLVFEGGKMWERDPGLMHHVLGRLLRTG